MALLLYFVIASGVSLFIAFVAYVILFNIYERLHFLRDNNGNVIAVRKIWWGKYMGIVD